MVKVAFKCNNNLEFGVTPGVAYTFLFSVPRAAYLN